MVTRIGGLASGMDIDELVKKLMSAEKAPLSKLQQKKQTYEWQRDAYRSVNTKLKTFDTYVTDNLVLKTLNSKTASSSNSSLVSAVATGQASGTLSIEGVSQLASSARGVGDQIDATGSTGLSAYFASKGATLPSSIELQSIDKQGNLGEKVKIEITSNMTISDLTSKINASNAGVSAVFENGRLSVTAKNTGQGPIGEKAIQFYSGASSVFGTLGLDTDSIQDGKNARFIVNGIATERTSNNFTINGYNVTLNSKFNEADAHNQTSTAAQTSFNFAETELTKTFSTLSGKYGIATAGKTLAELNTDYTNKFAELSTQYTKSVTDARTALADARDKKINGTTTGEVYNSLSNEAKEILKTVSIVSDGYFSDDVFNGTTISPVEQLKLKSFTGKQLSDINEIHVKQENLTNAETALTTASNKMINGSTAGDVVNSLSDNAKSFLKDVSIDSAAFLTDEDLVNADITEGEKTLLKSFSGEQIVDINAVQDTGVAVSNATTELANANSIDINKVTAVEGFNALSANAKEFLKTATIDENTQFSDVDLAALDTTPEEKKLLKAYSGNQLVDIKNVGVKTESFTTATTDLQTLNADMSKVVDNFKSYRDAKTNLDNVGSAPTLSPTVAPVTLTSTTNTDDMMTKIKDFVNTYNGLIKDLNDQTKETKYRDYTPLTTEQKEGMSENEIKLWEDKAKSGLLRGDSILRSGVANLRNIIYQTNQAIDDPKFNSLFSIGITTSKSYNDGGTLEINEEKLRKAIEENPDAVEKLFKNSTGKEDDTVQVTDRLGQVTTQKADTRGFIDKIRASLKSFEINIEQKAGRSTMTDNQYTIGKGIVDTDKRIDTWQTKLKTIEARYWKQFTAMETAINKANQQSSMFSQQQSQ